MNPFRWIARAFMARIGWVAAGLVLVALGFDARAGVVCSSGQVAAYDFRPSQSTADGFADTSQLACLNAITQASSQSQFESDVLSCINLQPTIDTSPSTFFKQRGPSFATTRTDPTADDYTVRFCRDANLSSDVCDFSVSGANGTLTAVGTEVCVDFTPPACELPPGTRAGWAESGSPTNACLDNCRLELKEGIDFFPNDGEPGAQFYATTGAICENLDPPPTLSPDTHLCGGEVCADAVTDEITDNTDPLLEGTTAEEVENEGCVTTASGGVFCVVDYEGPEVPDSGVPGTNATPDQTIAVPPPQNGNSTGDPTTVNYYNPTTVNNSTNVGTGDPDGEGQDSSGECEPGDTDCEGGGRGDGRVKGPGGNTSTFGEATDAFVAGVSGSGIGQLGSSVASAIPDGGTCPTATFAALDTSFTIDAHCTILDEYYNVLRAIFAFMWLALGALIILRA